MCRYGVICDIGGEFVTPTAKGAQTHPAAAAMCGVDAPKKVVIDRDLTASEKWLALESCKLFFEFFNIRKLPVDRCKSDIGNLVDLAQSPKRQLTDQ
jgi:hypothetical protein